MGELGGGRENSCTVFVGGLDVVGCVRSMGRCHGQVTTPVGVVISSVPDAAIKEHEIPPALDSSAKQAVSGSVTERGSVSGFSCADASRGKAVVLQSASREGGIRSPMATILPER